MRIAENKKMKTAALCALLALVVALCAVTFTGCTADAAAEPDLTDAAAEPDLPYVPSSDLPVEVVEPKNLADTLTVPLTDLQPYEPVRVETHSVETLFDGSHHDEHDGHHGQQQYRVGGGCHTTEGCATFAWSYDGNVYVSSQILAQSSFPGDYFLCIEEQAYNEETFTDVLGYDGVAISYLGEFEDDWTTTINDYYVFEEDGVYLLARVYGVPYLLDVNGDGINELVGTDGITQAQIFFQRNGELYEANISKLLNAYLERSDGDYWKYSYFCGWSENHPQYMELETKVPIATANGVETDFWWRRQVYFDGVNLYLYRPERKMNDHLLDGIQDLSAVTDAARELVKTRFEDWVENYGKGWNDPDHDPPEWDDYCITGIECTYMNDPGQLPGGFQLAVYEVDYEFHSPTPENVVRTGVIYVCDDGWAGGFHDEKHLVFQILDDGSYKLLENHMLYGASPSAGDFDGEISVVMMQNQLVKPSELSGETLFLGAMGNPAAFADALALYPDNEQDIALLKLLEHLDYMDSNGYYKMEYFQQIVEAMDDYSGNGAGVFQRLENLMVNPISFPPF